MPWMNSSRSGLSNGLGFVEIGVSKISSCSPWGGPFVAGHLLLSSLGPRVLPLRSSRCADFKTGLGLSICHVLMVILAIQCLILCEVGIDAFEKFVFCTEAEQKCAMICLH